MYMKMLSVGAKKHLVAAGRGWDAAETLCGCNITGSHNWKLLMGLEGDECEKCANRAFDFSPVGYRGPAAGNAAGMHY